MGHPQFLGVMIGPALNLLFTRVHFSLGPTVHVNELTAAGYFMVLPNFFCLVGFLIFFKEPPGPSGHPHTAHAHAHAHEDGAAKAAPSLAAERRRIFRRDGGWWCLLTAFMSTFNLSALETAITPITKAHFSESAGARMRGHCAYA